MWAQEKSLEERQTRIVMPLENTSKELKASRRKIGEAMTRIFMYIKDSLKRGKIIFCLCPLQTEQGVTDLNFRKKDVC